MQILAFFEQAGDRATAFVEPLVIALILLANAIIGVYHESNAEKAIEALKKLEPKHASVRREGHLVAISATELVPGDVVEVTTGDKVPADIRIIEILTPCMRVDQSLLTGLFLGQLFRKPIWPRRNGEQTQAGRRVPRCAHCPG